MTDTVAAEAVAREAIVQSAATGDEVAFARLVAEHHASMARVAFVICGDADATRDAVQVAWAIAWRRIGSLREPARIRPWLVAIAANEARKVRVRGRRRRVVDISEAVARAEGLDPIESLEVIDLQAALRRLRADERRLLAMRYAAELDSTEIAAELGLSASGVRSRLARIVERLRLDLGIPGEIDQ